MLIDTHAHIYLDRFDNDREAMLARARDAGVGAILMPAIDVNSIRKALALAEKHQGLFVMAALHPSETKEATDEDFRIVSAFCEHPKVVAVGESGLDYYWDRSFDERQHDFLKRHIQLAADRDLPLILHNREASQDLVRILQEEKQASSDPERIRGIFHCFGGPASFAEEVIALGFFVGLGGTLTFKNSGVSEAVRGVAMDRVVLETDAPFLAPVPHRGKRNEPAYVKLVAEKLAEVKGITVEEVERITTDNAIRLFKLPR